VRPRTLVLIVVLAATFYIVARSRRDFVDFEVYRVAAVRALSGEPLYRADDGHYQFKYWPAFAFAMAPFAPMPPEVGKPVWFALSVALLVLFVHWSIALLPGRRRPVRTLAWIVGLLIGKFVVKELVNGQTNLLLGTLMLLALMAAQQRRPIRAGVWTGAAVFVKPYALLFVPWLAATLAAVSVAAVMGVLAFGLLAPAVAYGWAGNLEQLNGWYQTVTSTTAPNLMIAENISFATMWAKWLGPGSTASALALVTSVAALAVAAAVCLARRNTEQPHYLEVALLLLLIPVLSPQGWDYVLILGTPAIALLVDRWGDLSPAAKAVAGASLAIVSFTVFDLIGRRLYMLSMAWSVQTVAVMGIVATLAWLRWRRLA
jgi:hypothetical protein